MGSIKEMKKRRKKARMTVGGLGAGGTGGAFLGGPGGALAGGILGGFAGFVLDKALKSMRDEEEPEVSED